MNGYQVPDFIKKGDYHITTDEEREEHDRKLRDKDVAVDLLTILMAEADQPLTAGEILERVRAWYDERTKKGKSFYFYWGQSSFREYLDKLSKIFPFGYLDRIEHNNVVKYQTNKWGQLMLEKHREWLEDYLGETIDEIKQSFSSLPTK
jgi:hypothetical protein